MSALVSCDVVKGHLCTRETRGQRGVFGRRGNVHYFVAHTRLDHRTPMHLAAETGQVDTMRLLIGAGGDACCVMDGGYTSAHCAAEGGR